MARSRTVELLGLLDIVALVVDLLSCRLAVTVTVKSWRACWLIGSVHAGAVLDGLVLLNYFALFVVCGVIEFSKSLLLFL